MVEDGLLVAGAEPFGDLMARCTDIARRTNQAAEAARAGRRSDGVD